MLNPFGIFSIIKRSYSLQLPDPLLTKAKDAELQDWIDNVNFLLNTGKYSFPIYTSDLDVTHVNAGEHYIVNNDTARSLTVKIGTVLCAINFTSSGAISGGSLGDRILDADANTGVICEFNSDENIIRHYTNGQYVVSMATGGIAVSAGYPFRFNGTGGNAYLVHNDTTGYTQFFVDGAVRMEI